MTAVTGGNEPPASERAGCRPVPLGTAPGGVSMRRYLVPMLVAALSAGLATTATATATATAATTAGPLGLSCAAYGGPTICSGEVPSFDGSVLDVDVTRPTTGSGAHPV